MAPKKAPEVVAAPPPPPDPEVLAQQERLEKWNQRSAELQKKVDDMAKYVNAAKLKQQEYADKLVALLERASDLAANKKPPPPPVAASAVPGKPPKGPAAKVEAAPVVVEPQLTPQELEDEAKKKAKITHYLMTLYKKKRQQTQQQAAITQSGSGVMTPREGATDDSPRSPTSSPTTVLPPSALPLENFTKPTDVPAELWRSMLALREERFETEASLAHIKLCVAKGDAHLQQLKAMGNLSVYAVVGSEHGLKQAATKVEERIAREQTARESALLAAAAAPSAAATAAAGATPAPKKK
ncbi:Hypothetical protein, putative [Bodo saltans]|uniref:Uncharacterized protein n=1 Tax=Bodo saltans TaxID=75058 RepID=A0A0S4JYK4_BODSA|nr:Hypothetical protein, putative [Bodo saltans]|eukprot:CUG94447.1 Hypothetical protein, putative [Bodo saltans]